MTKCLGRHDFEEAHGGITCGNCGYKVGAWEYQELVNKCEELSARLEKVSARKYDLETQVERMMWKNVKLVERLNEELENSNVTQAISLDQWAGWLEKEWRKSQEDE